jgi:hypothetical protein
MERPSQVERVLVPLWRPRRRGVATPPQAACTSNAGATARALDPRPPPETGDPHRGIALLIAGLTLLMVVEGALEHRAEEAALFAAINGRDYRAGIDLGSREALEHIVPGAGL